MKMIAANDPFAKALMHPQWDAVEKHFGSPAPEVLQAFYKDPTRVLQLSFDLATPKKVDGRKRIHVEAFEPITESSLEAFPGLESSLEIASDGGEGLYVIDPREADPEVFLFVMDGDDLFPTGLKLSKFLNAPRLPEEDDE